MRRLEERLDIAERMMKDKSFRENKGLGNEVGYYIFDYPPEKELIVRQRIENIQSRNRRGIDGFELIVFDLYEIMVSTLQTEAFLEQCYQFEKIKGIPRVTKSVGNLLRINDDASLIVHHIKTHTPQHSVVFITGVGKCYPILRSHTILNNLHQKIDHVPVVMFYPGQYSGQDLMLFGKIKDDNYYRAFRLAD